MVGIVESGGEGGIRIKLKSLMDRLVDTALSWLASRRCRRVVLAPPINGSDLTGAYFVMPGQSSVRKGDAGRSLGIEEIALRAIGPGIADGHRSRDLGAGYNEPNRLR